MHGLASSSLLNNHPCRLHMPTCCFRSHGLPRRAGRSMPSLPSIPSGGASAATAASAGVERTGRLAGQYDGASSGCCTPSGTTASALQGSVTSTDNSSLGIPSRPVVMPVSSATGPASGLVSEPGAPLRGSGAPSTSGQGPFSMPGGNFRGSRDALARRKAEEFVREIAIMKKLTHSNIVRLVEVGYPDLLCV